MIIRSVSSGTRPRTAITESGGNSTTQSHTATLVRRSLVLTMPSGCQGRSTSVLEGEARVVLLIATATSVASLSSSPRAASEMTTRGRTLPSPRLPGATAWMIAPRWQVGGFTDTCSHGAASGSKGSSSDSHHESGGVDSDLRAHSRSVALSGNGCGSGASVIDRRYQRKDEPGQGAWGLLADASSSRSVAMTSATHQSLKRFCFVALMPSFPV